MHHCFETSSSFHYTVLYSDVLPWGVEPQSMEPESTILSIELWERLATTKLQLYFGISNYIRKFAIP